MAIPYHPKLEWATYHTNPNWHLSGPKPPEKENESQLRRAISQIFVRTLTETGVRSVQFVRDLARLVLKVPIRAIKEPLWDAKNWKMRERCRINAQLTGYSFTQLLSVPAKFLVALAALATLSVSTKKAKWLLDKGDAWTSQLDGRASQLEAIKEVGTNRAVTRAAYDLYKTWVCNIPPPLCRKPK